MGIGVSVALPFRRAEVSSMEQPLRTYPPLKPTDASVHQQLSEREMSSISDRQGRFWYQQIESTLPADTIVVEENLKLLYNAAGCEPPHTVLWFDNPRLAAIAAMFLISPRRDGSYPRSKIDLYIEELKSLVDKIPNFTPGCRANWRFGTRPRARNSIYHEGSFFCTIKPLRRSVDEWDALRVNESRIPDELSLVWNRLAQDLGDRPQFARFKRGEPAIVPDEEHTRFVESFLDRERLQAVGFRSVLRSIGLCTFAEDGLEEILLNCGGFVPLMNVVIAVERPAHMHRDAWGRLHNQHGPSIEYPDGWGVYHLCGIGLYGPKMRMITAPETIELKDIEAEHNVEIRRLMIQTYGLERFLNDSNALLVHEDECGSLYRKRIDDFITSVVKVVNRTSEPDGTYKTYFLEVPPEMMTAKQAVAWTFDMEEADYQPIVET